jgi:hypothetical protein
MRERSELRLLMRALRLAKIPLWITLRHAGGLRFVLVSAQPLNGTETARVKQLAEDAFIGSPEARIPILLRTPQGDTLIHRAS